MFEEEYFKDRKFEDKYYRLALQYVKDLKPRTCLDYGCGQGFFTHALIYYGVATNGYDVSEWSVENAYGMSVNKLSNELPDNDKRFDLILCFDVLEHVPIDKVNEVLDDLVHYAKRYILLSICDITLKDVYVDPTHVTLRSRSWWENELQKKGLKKLEVPSDWHFANQLYLYEKN